MNIPPDQIINHCLEFYDLPREMVFSKSLKPEFVLPRQMTQRMISKFTDMSSVEIAKKFDTTRCTVRVNILKIDNLYDVNPKIRRQFIELSNQLEEML